MITASATTTVRSAVLASSPDSPHVLQATEGWVKPGNEASRVLQDWFDTCLLLLASRVHGPSSNVA